MSYTVGVNFARLEVERDQQYRFYASHVLHWWYYLYPFRGREEPTAQIVCLPRRTLKVLKMPI